MAIWRKSLIWQLLLPMPVILVVLVAGWLSLPSMLESNVVDSAVAAAEQTVNQFNSVLPKSSLFG
ncbi:MAG: hypothetical protein OEU92_08090 [Alphaproteobacteria bacterium]|nr:hypothetical protein [Alphaproteobacteria bacterium]